MTSLDELKQKVLEVDLSVNNPKVQEVVERNIEELVKEYQFQEKTRAEIEEYNKQENVKKRSCPKYIPDKIAFGERKYTPQQTLEHVKARDEDGMYILRVIGDKVMNKPKTHMLAKELQKSLVYMVTEKNADKVAISCICGKHSVTHRDMLQGFVDFNPDIGNFTDMIYRSALFSLYDKEKDKPKTPQPKEGLLAKIKNYLFK